MWSLQPYTRGRLLGNILCYQAGDSFRGVDAPTGVQRWTFDWDWGGNNELDTWSWGVVDSLVLLRGRRHDLVVLDALSGKLRWQRRTQQRVYVVVSDGIAFIASHEGPCLAFDAGSGTELWRLDLRPSAAPTALSAGAGIVCLPTESDEVLGIDAATGAKRWSSIAAPEHVIIQRQFGLVFLVHVDRLVALDALSGLERWRFTAGGRIESRILQDDRIIYVVNHVGTALSTDHRSVLTAIDALTGEQSWCYETDSHISSVGLAEHVVYVTDGDYYLHALEGHTGHESWCSEVWGENDDPVVVNETVFLADERYGLRAVDATTGAELWAFSPDESLASWSGAMVNGFLFAGAGTTVFVLDAVTGEELSLLAFDGLVITHVEAIDNVILAHGDDFLHALRLIPA